MDESNTIADDTVQESGERSHGKPEGNSTAQSLSSVKSGQVDLNQRRETGLSETDQETTGERTGEILYSGEAGRGDTPEDGASSQNLGHEGTFTEKSKWHHSQSALSSEYIVNSLNGA